MPLICATSKKEGSNVCDVRSHSLELSGFGRENAVSSATAAPAGLGFVTVGGDNIFLGVVVTVSGKMPLSTPSILFV